MRFDVATWYVVVTTGFVSATHRVKANDGRSWWRPHQIPVSPCRVVIVARFGLPHLRTNPTSANPLRPHRPTYRTGGGKLFASASCPFPGSTTFSPLSSSSNFAEVPVTLTGPPSSLTAKNRGPGCSSAQTARARPPSTFRRHHVAHQGNQRHTA